MQDAANKFSQFATQLKNSKTNANVQEDMSPFIKEVSESIGVQIVLAKECYKTLLEKCKLQDMVIGNVLMTLLDYKAKQNEIKTVKVDSAILFQDLEKGELMIDLIKHMSSPIDKFKEFTRELLKISESNIEDNEKERKIIVSIIGYEF